MAALSRRLLNLLTATSLLVCVAAVLWPAWAFPVRGSAGLGHFQTRHGLLFDATEVHHTDAPRVWYRPTPLLLFCVAAAAAALPVRWCVVHSREYKLRSRRATGLCPRCGYDLRATPERCPECGAAGVMARR